MAKVPQKDFDVIVTTVFKLPQTVPRSRNKGVATYQGFAAYVYLQDHSIIGRHYGEKERYTFTIAFVSEKSSKNEYLLL